MSGWISAINPFSNPTTEPQARRAARASALAIGLGVLMSAYGILYMTTFGREEIQAAMDEAMSASPEAAGMAGMIGSAMLGLTVAILVIQAILGLVQWFKPNVVIPIIFVILVIYGLGSTGLSLMMRDQMELSAGAPMWQTWLTMGVMVVQLLLHIAGIRGASALGKLRSN